MSSSNRHRPFGYVNRCDHLGDYPVAARPVPGLPWNRGSLLALHRTIRLVNRRRMPIDPAAARAAAETN